MKLTLRFTSKEMAKLNFQKIIPKFFDGTFRDLFPGKFRKMMIEIDNKEIPKSLNFLVYLMDKK